MKYKYTCKDCYYFAEDCCYRYPPANYIYKSAIYQSITYYETKAEYPKLFPNNIICEEFKERIRNE